MVTLADVPSAGSDGVLIEFCTWRGAILSCGPRRAIATAIANTVPDADCVSQIRLHLMGFQLPDAVRVYQREYDLRSVQMLEESAKSELAGNWRNFERTPCG
jgi:hypothetical protein